MSQPDRRVTQLPFIQVPATPRLTERQQAAWDYVRTREGVTAAAVGCVLHVRGGKHGADPCEWCEKDGFSVLTSKAIAPLITYSNVDGRRVYRARRSQPRERVPVREPTEAEIARDPFAGL